MLKVHGTPRSKPGPSLILRGAAANSVRLDGKDHWPMPSVGKPRCKVCSGRSAITCEKCNVAVHSHPCFKQYHTTRDGEF